MFINCQLVCLIPKEILPVKDSSISYRNYVYYSLLVDLTELASYVSSNNAEEVPHSSGMPGRRKSRRRTGRLVTVNNQKIALLKFKGTVYAVDELCPHMGE